MQNNSTLFSCDEVWRDVVGYEGLYQVSNYGRVKSLDRIVIRKNSSPLHIKECIRKPQVWSSKDNPNYKQLQVSLYKNIKPTNKKVHQLVAMAFPEICGEYYEGCEVDHLDTDTFNNKASNLRVCSGKENHNNPLTRKHMSEARKGTIPWNKDVKGCFSEETCKKRSVTQKGKKTYAENPNAKPILQLTLDGEVIKEWDCAKSAIEYYHLNQPSLSMHLHGKTKMCGGYKWVFKKEGD